MSKNWISMHVFYTSNLNPMLVDCIAPLINELREHALIQRYFFIRYWQEGPHLRLRLLPAEGVEQEEVIQVVEPVIAHYLKRRPALYEPDEKSLKFYFKEMFIAEYGEEQWVEQYGADGEMPIRPNNSFHYIEYEPEYGRYGGVDGIELAEWHFEHSSDIVLKSLTNVNVSIRTILLGLSVQLALPLCYGLMQENEKVRDFFDGYMKYWHQNYHRKSDYDSFDKKYLKMAPDLQRRMTEIQHHVVDGDFADLIAFEQEWMRHIHELRIRIKELVEAEKLVFWSREEEREPIVIKDLNTAYNRLLRNYVHMVNNRLGASIVDEDYLSYLLKRALEDKLRNREVQEVA